MINDQIINQSTIIVFAGRELDNNNAHEMVGTIEGFQEKGYKYIIIDASELEFLSSAGVGSILGTIEYSREAGGDIIICNASDKILHILEVLDVKAYLTLANSMEEAREICPA